MIEQWIQTRDTRAHMERPRALAIAIGWIAMHLIGIGQNLIRTAYQWLRWSERP